MQPKKFAIVGERCSGTNFMEKVMKTSFNLEQVKGSTTTMDHKHWMQPENYADRSVTDNIIYIGIIREPVQWLGSLFHKPYHVPLHMRTDPRTFLTSEWYSFNDEGDCKEIMHDRHPYTKERFKNIFELRKVKAQFLLEDMPKLVKNYVFVRYEDLTSNMPMVLQKISNVSGIPIVQSSQSLIRKPRKHTFGRAIMNLIRTNIDKEVEKSVGYSVI